ncbi:ATPase, T2SS/T4P/T4SS family [Planctomycetes bacterium K23_9]|uniref:Type II secretion system protein E n=1 Tax=Stieleria marina TaxID=1930275 RepID=A0A517NSK4_9BACT|nr:Putative type II secretion system protein E [Planctomycetes bacterium K23_9]
MAKQSAASDEQHVWQTGTQVEFSPKIKERTEAQSLLVLARQGAGYEVASGLLGHAIQSRSTHLLLDFSQRGCAIRYQIDGNWEQVPPLERETADAMLYAIKQLCLMNPADRRSQQTGSIDIKCVKDKYEVKVQSQGVPTGERVLVKLEAEKIAFDRMTDLGMRDKMLEAYKDHLNSDGTIVLVTAPKSEGLTTSWVLSLNTADRLIRDFQSFEEEGSGEPDIINISPNYYGGETGKSQEAVVKSACLKEPDVLLFPELPLSESMDMALNQVEKNDKQIMTRTVARTATEGLVMLLAKYPELAPRIAAKIRAVIGQRLIRRLCDNCKVGFEPPPQLLKQLGIPAGRVAMLYQPFLLPPIEQQVDENGNPAPITPCHVCNGRGYYGRIAIFELLAPGEKLRDALLKTKDVAQLNAIAKSEGHRSLQTEAVLTVARGLTGLDELKKLFAKK